MQPLLCTSPLKLKLYFGEELIIIVYTHIYKRGKQQSSHRSFWSKEAVWDKTTKKEDKRRILFLWMFLPFCLLSLHLLTTYLFSTVIIIITIKASYEERVSGQFLFPMSIAFLSRPIYSFSLHTRLALIHEAKSIKQWIFQLGNVSPAEGFKSAESLH